MARIVVKLGSGVVARDDGALRPDVLAGVCDVVAERHAAGDEIVVVTSGAIARGLQVMGLGGRPTAIEDLQAASAVGQGKLYRVYDELLRDRGLTSAQVLLTFHDVSARAQYLNARQTLARLLAWRVVPVVNENDTTATDEISFGDNDFLAAQVAVLVGADLLVLLTGRRRPIHGRPAPGPGRARRVDVVRGPADLEGLEVGRTTTALGSGGMRSKVVAAEMATAAGIPAVVCDGLDPAALRLVLGGRPGRDALRGPGGPPLVLQALAALRQARAGRGPRRRRRRPGAARRRDVAAARRGRRRPRGVRRGRRRRGPRRGRPRRQGDLELLRRRTAPRQGPEVGRRPRRAAAGDRGGRPPRLLRAGVSELVASPLLVPHVRSPGGAGGRRLRVVREDGGFVLVVEDHGRAPSRRWYGEPPALVHAYNDELRRAARGGLTSRPAPAPLSARGLPRAGGRRVASSAWLSRPPPSPSSAAPPRPRPRVLATLPTTTKDAALPAIADALEARTPEILEANARDVEAGREAGALRRAARPAAPRRRPRRARWPTACAHIAALRDPVGEVIEGFRLPNGLDVDKVRVAARRRRGRLRGAPERHDRRRRAVPEVGQRDRPARVVDRGALQRRPGRDRRRGRRGGRPARRAR